MHNLVKISISDKDIELLKNLKEQRVIIFSNHPTNIEPIMIFYLSRFMNSIVKFMTSRAVFDWFYGIVGFVIRRGGAYSILAGINDMASFHHSVSILSQENGKLVIFPEGEPISRENMTLMPFQEGFSFLSVVSLDKARQHDPKADILVLPIFFFYNYAASFEEMKQNIRKRLEWLENKIGIQVKPSDTDDLLKRSIYIGRAIIEEYENKYGISPEKDQDYKYRAGRLRHCMLDKMGKVLQVKNYNVEDNAILKLRKIYSMSELYKVRYQGVELPKFSKAEYKRNEKELKKIFQLIILNEDNLKTEPTYEKLFEALHNYELINQKAKSYPPALPREAHIKIGRIFHISEYYSKEKKERKKLMGELTERVKQEIQNLVQEVKPLSHKY